MMKRTIAFLICAVMLLSTAVLAFADDLPSINSAIKGKKTKNKKTEVSDTLKGYNPDNESTQDFGKYKMVILERQMPKKEFTEVTYDYESAPYDNGFPKDYKGVDKGKARVWYRGDLMKKIPSSYRAKSVEKADIIVIGENYYEWSGTISSYNYEGGSSQLPEFDTVEEMIQYMQTHERKIKSITYHPVFRVYTMVDIYNRKTKKVAHYNVKSVDAEVKNLVNNPDASKQWEQMQTIYTVMVMLTDSSPNKAEIKKQIAACDFVSESKKKVWSTCVDGSEWEDAAYSISQYYWEMAAKLKGLDPSEENRANYDLIIADKSYSALNMFVGFCNYSGFSKSIKEIGESGEYMGVMDKDWLKESLNKFINEFK